METKLKERIEALLAQYKNRRNSLLRQMAAFKEQEQFHDAMLCKIRISELSEVIDDLEAEA